MAAPRLSGADRSVTRGRGSFPSPTKHDMPDFFDNLLARTTTHAPLLRPRIAPRFAPPTPEPLVLPHESSATTEAPSRESPIRPTRAAAPPRAVTHAAPPHAPPADRDGPAPHADAPATNAAAVSQFPPQANKRIEAQVVAPQPFSALQPRSITSDSQHESSAQARTATHNALESARAGHDHDAPVSPPRAPLTPRRAIEPATTRLLARIETRVAESRPTTISERRQPPDTTHAPPAPTIQVTIGRIEVRAESSPPAHRAAPAAPRLTLDEYLRQRNGGDR